MRISTFVMFLVAVSVLAGCSKKKEKAFRAHSVVRHPAWSNNKTIYEVNLRQYTKEGTFKAFQAHLPRLQEMGVGVIWLMPIHPVGMEKRKGSLGSVYAVRDYYGINPEFGTEDDFRTLVDAIHDAGMFVIIDWVANHSAWDNPLKQSHPEFYSHSSSGDFIPAARDWEDVIEFNYDNLDMRRYMLDALKYWVKEFGIDGYRCDVADLVPTDFWDQARRELEMIKPVFMLAEAEAAFLHNRAFDATYDRKLYGILNEISKGYSKAKMIWEMLRVEKRTYPETAWRMRYTSNHDENAFIGTATERLQDAAKACAVLTVTLPGKPMIYGGQEVGLDKRLAFFEKDEIKWQESTFRAFYKKLFVLYKENPALYAGSLQKLETPDDIFAFVREADGYKVVVVLNFSVKQNSFVIQNSLLAGNYTELFSNVPVVFSEEKSFDLEPWGYRVFVENKMIAQK